MRLLRVVGSLDPAEGGLSQAIRSSVADLEKLGIFTEVVCCDSAEVKWLGSDSFPVHAMGPRKYGFAYTPKLRPWLEENLARFDAVIIDGLWLWPSVCATRAVRALRRKRKTERTFSHSRVCETAEGKLGKIREDESERLATDRTSGAASCRVTPALGELSSETADGAGTLNSKQLRCFVMPHGMLDPWFQRDKSRRVKAVRNWVYWWLIERDVVNSADGLLFTCQQELELARTTFEGYRPKEEIVVGLGVEEPPAFEPEMREAFTARCPGLKGRQYLLFMSRVHAKKNVAALVRAFARVRREVLRGLKDQGSNGPKDVEFPDLVIAGPGWDSAYGREVRALIDEVNRTARAEGGGVKGLKDQGSKGHPKIGDQRSEGGSAYAPSDSGVTGAENCELDTEHFGRVHAVDMLAGDSKWGALYGCEAFVLPSHQENFGIAVVEALACGKPVLISDQVNIWREIVEDGAGIAEADTEEGVEKLLRRFLDGRRQEGDSRVSHGLARMDEDKSERLSADRTEGNASCRVTPAVGGESSETANGGPRECYLKRFAIGPAAAKLAEVVKG